MSIYFKKNPNVIQEEIDKILDLYIGRQACKLVVEQMQQHINSHLLKKAGLVGNQVKLKLIATNEGVIRNIKVGLREGVFDPSLPAILNKATSAGRKVVASVDKNRDIIHYSWEGGSNDLLNDTNKELVCSTYRKLSWENSNKKPIEEKPIKVRFKRLKKSWIWLKSQCPIEVRWKPQPEPMHPYFEVPMSEVEYWYDCYRLMAHEIDSDQLLAEKKERARLKKLNKWWNIRKLWNK